jgi:hypothetical protein
MPALEAVFVYYQPPNGGWLYTVAVHSNGAYAAGIGPFAQSGIVNFYVKARDAAGAEVWSDMRRLEVLACATPTPTDDLLPVWQPSATPTATPEPQPVTVILQNGLDGYAGASDTWIDRWNPTQNYDETDRDFLRIRSDMQQSPLIRFDLSPIPAGATVLSARLDLLIASRTNANSLPAEIYRLLRPWDATTATWEIAKSEGGPAHWEQPGALGSLDRQPDPSGWLTFNQEEGNWSSTDVTELAQYWMTNPSENRGILLAGGAGGGVGYTLHASDSHHTAGRPRLTVTYLPAGY